MIHLDEKPEVVRAFLKYLYTGQVGENLLELATELLPLAYKFQQIHLMLMCAFALECTLTSDNIVDVLVMTRRHFPAFHVHLALQFAHLFQSKSIVLSAENEEKLMAHPDILAQLMNTDYSCIYHYRDDRLPATFFYIPMVLSWSYASASILS